MGDGGVSTTEDWTLGRHGCYLPVSYLFQRAAGSTAQLHALCSVKPKVQIPIGTQVGQPSRSPSREDKLSVVFLWGGGDEGKTATEIR